MRSFTVVHEVIELYDLRGEYKTRDNYILPRGSAEKVRRTNQQGIKPPTRLIDSFADEVCWEGLFESFLVLEWIVNLCVWHTGNRLCDG